VNTASTIRPTPSTIDKGQLEGKEFAELGHVPISVIPLYAIKPSPENSDLYRPVNPDDPEIIALAASIKEHGILEPLTVTTDYFLISGHRRHTAASVAGLESVPCRVMDFCREDDPDRFVVLLRENNRQREKSFDEKLREELVNVDPFVAYQSLIQHRAKQSKVKVAALDMGGVKRRAEISDAKQPFLQAILKVLEDNAEFLPLSDRSIHYRLLNDPPLRHASKRKSGYQNDKASYKSLVDLVTRARLKELIPMESIADETRPVVNWTTWRDVGGFVRDELNDLLKGYWRDLMQSQPNHVEILVEKNTVAGIVKQVAMRYCIPMTSGRGFCSLPPRHGMAERFKKSGKEKLVVLIIADFDPDGEQIATSFSRSMRDDFGISSVWPIKVALTAGQVKQFKLPPGPKAKKGSTNYAKFVSEYGKNVFELEAITPAVLQRLVRDAIDAVIDRDLFNRELDQERQDAAELEAVRRTVVKAIQRKTTPGGTE
jgi:ParB-like chromosome segregation protein Spo0J